MKKIFCAILALALCGASMEAQSCCSGKKDNAKTEAKAGSCCSSKKDEAKAGSCCSGKKDEAKAGSCCSGKKAEAAAPAAGQSVAYFKAAPMKCGGCKAKVEKNIGAAEGVSGVEVNLDEKSVKVTYDPSKTDVDKIKEAFGGFEYAAQTYYPNEKTSYITFKADQMKCGGCAAKVTRTLKADKGVKDVTVCLANKSVAVAYDPAKTSEEGLLKDFKTIEYNVEVLYK